MYSNLYSFGEGPYTGQSASEQGRCPVCGSTGECPDGAAVSMPIPPFGIDDNYADPGGPLRHYRVTVFDTTTVMQLNDADAARYGDAAVLIS